MNQESFTITSKLPEDTLRFKALD